MKKQGLPFPDVRYQRQEWFDIESLELSPWHVGGKEYLVYGNVNVSIFLTDQCNGNCPFCVAELRYQHDGEEYCKPAIAGREEYLGRLREVLEAIRPLNPSISITGGEPSLSPWLVDVLREVDLFGFRKRTMTTNGAGLLQPVEGLGTLVGALGHYGIEYLNISRAHHDETINQQLMKMDPAGLTNRELGEVVRLAWENKIRPRLSCVLLKSGVHSLEQMENYLAWAENLTVDNVVFRQLMSFADNSCGSVVRFAEDEAIDLLPLMEGMSANERFEFTNFVLGYYYYVEVYRHRGIDVVAETADLSLISKEREKSKNRLGLPVIYELVFHPNGSLCGSWREYEEIILPYEKVIR